MSGRTVRWGYTRFLALSKVRFCSHCVSDEEARAYVARGKRMSLTLLIVFLLMAIPAPILFWRGEHGRGDEALLQILIGITLMVMAMLGLFHTLCGLIPKLKGTSSKNFHEFMMGKVLSYANESREQWARSFDLSGFDLIATDAGSSSAKAFSEYVVALIEPAMWSKGFEYVYVDGAGRKWRSSLG